VLLTYTGRRTGRRYELPVILMNPWEHDDVDEVVHIVDSTHVHQALEALEASEPRAVLVLIGGA